VATRKNARELGRKELQVAGAAGIRQFTGRAGALSRLDDVLDACQDAPAVVVVSGAAGDYSERSSPTPAPNDSDALHLNLLSVP